mmetsp:Transcript_2020/g.4096  ORF Transcript_2020/g.4096 Transcript_2020/m.4096 type:complete len:211 (+) Transcript_2020:289-921(+)
MRKKVAPKQQTFPQLYKNANFAGRPSSMLLHELNARTLQKDPIAKQIMKPMMRSFFDMPTQHGKGGGLLKVIAASAAFGSIPWSSAADIAAFFILSFIDVEGDGPPVPDKRAKPEAALAGEAEEEDAFELPVRMLKGLAFFPLCGLGVDGVEENILGNEMADLPAWLSPCSRLVPVLPSSSLGAGKLKLGNFGNLKVENCMRCYLQGLLA